MSKRLSAVFAAIAAILLVGALSFLAKANDKPQTWKGVVTMVCAAPPPAGSPGATGDACRFTLLTPNDKKLYVLNPQEQAGQYMKKAVTVTGTVSGAAKIKMVTNDGVVEASTIQVSKISPVPGS